MNNIDRLLIGILAIGITAAVILYDVKSFDHRAHQAVRAVIDEGTKYMKQEQARREAAQSSIFNDK